VTGRGLGSNNTKLASAACSIGTVNFVHSQNAIFAIDHALRRLASWEYVFAFPLFLVVCQAAAIDVAMDRPGASGLTTGVWVGRSMSIKMDIMRGKRAGMAEQERD
jgi:hypothetical protein